MTIASLGLDGLWLPGAKAPAPAHLERVRNVGALFDAMDRQQITTLYVHRSALEPMGLPLELEVPPPGERRPEHAWSADARYRGERVSTRCLAPSITAGRLEVLIGAWQDGAGDPFADALDARELLAAAVMFALAFASEQHPDGWLFRHTAMSTGWRLMHGAWRTGTRRRRGEQLRRALAEHGGELELDGLEPGEQAEVPYGSWARQDVKGTSRRYLAHAVAWDVNGQRLAACSRLELGIGPPEPRAPADFDAKLPGYHFVSGVSEPWRGRIPPIFTPGWHTTPRVAMARYLGLELELTRSIVWPAHVAYLDPFYVAFRQAREFLLEGVRAERREARIALDVLKQAYLQPLGRLRSRRAREAGDVFYRPAWYDAVIGQELAREYLRLHQLAELGEPVLAVYFDAIVLEAESPDLDRPPAPLELSPQLGKFKAVGAMPGDQARQLLHGENGPEVGRLIQALKTPPAATGGRNPARPAGPEGPAESTVAALSDAYRPAHGGYPVHA